MIPSRERKWGGETSTKSGCSKKKKNVSSDPCEVVTEWEERDGRDRKIDDRRAKRKIIHVHSCIRFPGAGKKNIDRDIDDRGKKSYVEHQMTEEGQAHT